MNSSRRIVFPVSGVLCVVCLLVVCLLLANGWVRHPRQAPRRVNVAAKKAPPISIPSHPSSASFARHREPRRRHAPGSALAAAKGTAPRRGRAARPSSLAAQVEPAVTSSLLEAPRGRTAPSPLPPPNIIRLEPLGYVERKGRQVEAVISLQDRVQVVHEGDILEGNLKVARVSSASVELVENSPVVSEAPAGAVAAPGEVHAAAQEARQPAFLSAPRGATNSGSRHPGEVEQVAAASRPSASSELGYVERRDGRVEAIIADGQYVSLRQASKSFPGEFRPAQGAPTNVELAEVSPPADIPRDIPSPEGQPAQTESMPPPAKGTPRIEVESEASAANRPPGPPVREVDGKPESAEDAAPGFNSAAALADYSDRVTEPAGVTPAPPSGPGEGSSGRPLEPPDAAAALSPPGSVPYVGPPVTGGGALPLSTAGVAGINTLGYVEKGGGEKEGIVEAFGEVYLVHEGELFAGRYRVLKVTPSLVQVVEEPKERSALPWRAAPNSEVVPPVFAWVKLRAGPQDLPFLRTTVGVYTELSEWARHDGLWLFSSVGLYGSPSSRDAPDADSAAARREKRRLAGGRRLLTVPAPPAEQPTDPGRELGSVGTLSAVIESSHWPEVPLGARVRPPPGALKAVGLRTAGRDTLTAQTRSRKMSQSALGSLRGPEGRGGVSYLTFVANETAGRGPPSAQWLTWLC